jgi:hypothetical protein
MMPYGERQWFGLKPPQLADADVLVAYIVGQRDEATEQWQKLQRAS